MSVAKLIALESQKANEQKDQATYSDALKTLVRFHHRKLVLHKSSQEDHEPQVGARPYKHGKHHLEVDGLVHLRYYKHNE